MIENNYMAKSLETGKWVHGAFYKHLNRTPCPMGDKITEKDFTYYIITHTFSDWNMPTGIQAIEIDPNTACECTDDTETMEEVND